MWNSFSAELRERIYQISNQKKKINGNQQTALAHYAKIT